jgi:hypothetical protein
MQCNLLTISEMDTVTALMYCLVVMSRFANTSLRLCFAIFNIQHGYRFPASLLV